MKTVKIEFKKNLDPKKIKVFDENNNEIHLIKSIELHIVPTGVTATITKFISLNKEELNTPLVISGEYEAPVIVFDAIVRWIDIEKVLNRETKIIKNQCY